MNLRDVRDTGDARLGDVLDGAERNGWAQRAGTMPRPHVRRRAYRRLDVRQRFIPLLVGVALFSTLAVVVAGYIGARAFATAEAQARLTRDTQVVRDSLAQLGGDVRLRDGHLEAGPPDHALTLNSDTSLVDRLHNDLGNDVAIYQLQGPSLVSVAASVGQNGQRPIGEALIGPANDALLGQCGAISSDGCHHAYSGLVARDGGQAAAAYAPLLDHDGNFLGAVAVRTSLDGVLAWPLQLMVVLLLVGILMALLAVVAATWLFGRKHGEVLDALDERLATLAASASALRDIAEGQASRAQRQEALARQLGVQVRDLDELAHSIGHGEEALRDTANEIWAGTSQPGASLNPQQAVRLAKQAAVLAARVGAAAEETHVRCRTLSGLSNQVIAEGQVLAGEGRETARHASDLRTAIEQVEIALGERLSSSRRPAPQAGREHGPLGRVRERLVTYGLSRMPDRRPAARGMSPMDADREARWDTAGRYAAPDGMVISPQDYPGRSGARKQSTLGWTTGQMPAVRRPDDANGDGGTGERRTPPRLVTGQHPAIGDAGRTGQHPAMRPSAPGMSRDGAVRPGLPSLGDELPSWRVPPSPDAGRRTGGTGGTGGPGYPSGRFPVVRLEGIGETGQGPELPRQSGQWPSVPGHQAPQAGQRDGQTGQHPRMPRPQMPGEQGGQGFGGANGTKGRMPASHWEPWESWESQAGRGPVEGNPRLGLPPYRPRPDGDERPQQRPSAPETGGWLND